MIQAEFCVNGKKRKEEIDNLFAKIQEISFPTYLSQAAECAKRGQDIFNTGGQSKQFMRFPTLSSVLRPSEIQLQGFKEMKNQMALLHGSLSEFSTMLKDIQQKYNEVSNTAAPIWANFMKLLSTDQKRDLFLQFEGTNLEDVNELEGELQGDKSPKREPSPSKEPSVENTSKSISILRNSFDFYRQSSKAASFQTIGSNLGGIPQNFFKIRSEDPILEHLRNGS